MIRWLPQNLLRRAIGTLETTLLHLVIGNYGHPYAPLFSLDYLP
jgi:hypothetical protein